MKTVEKYNFNFDIAIEMLEVRCKGFICYKRELKLYKKIINSIKGLTYVRENEIGKTGQFFEAQFGEVSQTSGLEYIIIWNVQRAEKLIEEKNIVPIDYTVENYIESFKEIEINKEHAKKYNPSPIIVAKGPHNEDIIIDGNHRMHYAIENNIKTIKAYVLNIEDSIGCLHTEEFKKIFKIHKNLMEISNRVCGLNKRKLSLTDEFEKGKLFSFHHTQGSFLLSSILLCLEI